MDKNKRQQPDLSNQAVRWAAYSLRDSFSLFELACLVHRLDPEAVHDDAVAAVKQHGGTMADVFASDHMGAVRVMYASPAMYFIPPVGETLEVMKLATSPTFGYSVSKDRAKRITQGLGYQWPVELEHHAPAPVVAVNPSDAPAWTVSKPQRYNGYTAPLQRLLAAAHRDGKTCPTARDVVEDWRNNTPAEIAKVLPDGFDYYDAKGDTKTADLEAIRKAIGRMTSAR